MRAITDQLALEVKVGFCYRLLTETNVNAREAIEKLIRGNVVAIPTETVYGLAARVDREDALRRIFTTKQRPFFDPLIVHVADVDSARSLAREWPRPLAALAEAFWPGPLTLIAKKRAHVSDVITAGLDSVGLRAPAHPLALDILRGVGVPLAAPSANRFTHTSPTEAAHVRAEFGDAVDVVDGGPCAVGVESTIVALSERGLELLRPGGITRDALADVLKSFNLEIFRATSAAAPGQMKAHYQPANPVALVTEHIDLAARFPGHRLFELILPTEAALAARSLYAELRRLSAQPGLIHVRADRLPKTPAWEAIWDRLERASSFDLR